jgi:hypothetical protein
VPRALCWQWLAPVGVNSTQLFVEASLQTYWLVNHILSASLQTLDAMKTLPWLIASAAFLSGSVFAQVSATATPAESARTLRSELTVKQVVVLDNGTESLRSAAEVKPNDLLQYAASYVNSGPNPVKHLVASLPIPPGTQWVDASAVPRTVLASTDGKLFLPTPLMRRVKDASGRLIDQPVPLSEYRALRWAEQVVAPGATYTVSARVRVVGLTTSSTGTTANTNASTNTNSAAR